MSNPFVAHNGEMSLYIHIPFCEHKCPYCAYESSVPSKDDTEVYLNLLEKEIEWWNERIGKPTLSTCYIGGGTPTILNSQQWTKLTEIIDRYFNFIPSAEVAVEANPNSLKAEQLHVWRDWRINRISIGVQSFDDAELVQLGRMHTSAQAYNALSAALVAGFSVNADFMFGLPSQSFLNWGRTLKDAVKTGIHHISLYQLSLEPETVWENMPSENLTDGYYPYRWAQWYLPRKGYDQYEVSNFSKAGHESKHNINYWREGEYLGVGAGASGYLSEWRYKNIGIFKEYKELLTAGKCVLTSGERLKPKAKSREAFVLALRMADGVNRNDYREKYGVLNEQKQIDVLKSFPKDLYKITDKNIKLTAKGMRVANIIWSELI